MSDTGAKLPDPCRLVDDDLVTQLVGPSAMTREKDGKENSDCRWESKADPAPSDKTLSGLLQIGTFTQLRQVEGGQRFNDAKIAYRAAQLQKPCAPLEVASADEACWQQDESGLRAAVRKGYTTVTISYTAAHSPALKEPKKEETAGRLATEILDHLSP
jgi:hypothetical protein